jgi:uncharacterized membrane protein YkoI
MKTTIIFISVLAGLAPLGISISGCSDDVAAPASVTAAEAESLAEARTGGTAGAAQLETEDGVEFWSIEVTMSNEATLSVAVIRDSGVLREVKGREGPFDYELSPLDGMLSYAEALAKAKTYQEGELEAWYMKLGADGAYFFEYYLRAEDTQLWEVKVTPDTGELIEKEAKSAID